MIAGGNESVKEVLEKHFEHYRKGGSSVLCGNGGRWAASSSSTALLASL